MLLQEANRTGWEAIYSKVRWLWKIYFLVLRQFSTRRKALVI